MLAQLAANCHQMNCTGHVDNTPAYYIFGAIGAVMLIGAAAAASDSASRNRTLTRGVAATAEIVRLSPRRVRNDGTVTLDLTLAVTPPGGEVFEAEAAHTFPITALPQAGWTLPVRYRADARHHLVVAGEPSPPAVPPAP
ncbi:hypothetical protein [Streptomyces sp. NPDC020983]|uniref:hypothetical protein n=1 Tax=Streptomyces sp. NPDC020983 TaxID=3365106 RepID=UPI0037BA319C